MTEKQRGKAVKKLKESIIPSIDIESLINSPDENLIKQDIYEAKAIFTNFDYGDGERLEKLINNFLEVARAKKRPEHIKNLANDIRNYIIKKTEDMERYRISDGNNKIFKKFRYKKSILLVLLLLTIGVILYFFKGWNIEKINLGGVELIPPLKSDKETEFLKKPDLSFRGIEFIYYGLDYKPIKDLDSNLGVNLENITRIEFNAIIKNNSDYNLLVTTKSISISSSHGQIIIDKPLDIPAQNAILLKNETALIPMNGIVASDLLNAFKKDEFLYLIFKPQLEYSMVDKSEKKFTLDIIMKCSNLYKGNQLPIFKPNCYPEKI